MKNIILEASNYDPNLKMEYNEISKNSMPITAKDKGLNININTKGPRLDNFMANSQNCIVHPLQKAKYCCFDCKEIDLCGDCIVNKVHQPHNVKLTEIALKEIQDSTFTLYEEFQKVFEIISHSYDKLSDVQNMAKKIHIELKQFISEIFSQFYVLIKDKENLLLSQCEEEFKRAINDSKASEKKLSTLNQNVEKNILIMQEKANSRDIVSTFNFYFKNRKALQDQMEFSQKLTSNTNDLILKCQFTYNQSKVDRLKSSITQFSKDILAINLFDESKKISSKTHNIDEDLQILQKD